jgi:hypothetical protein
MNRLDRGFLKLPPSKRVQATKCRTAWSQKARFYLLIDPQAILPPPFNRGRSAAAGPGVCARGGGAGRGLRTGFLGTRSSRAFRSPARLPQAAPARGAAAGSGGKRRAGASFMNGGSPHRHRPRAAAPAPAPAPGGPRLAGCGAGGRAGGEGRGRCGRARWGRARGAARPAHRVHAGKGQTQNPKSSA